MLHAGQLSLMSSIAAPFFRAAAVDGEKERGGLPQCPPPVAGKGASWGETSFQRFPAPAASGPGNLAAASTASCRSSRLTYPRNGGSPGYFTLAVSTTRQRLRSVTPCRSGAWPDLLRKGGSRAALQTKPGDGPQNPAAPPQVLPQVLGYTGARLRPFTSAHEPRHESLAPAISTAPPGTPWAPTSGHPRAIRVARPLDNQS